MRIQLSSVMVGNQDHALRFYTEVLGFLKKKDIPLGEARWLSVASPKVLAGYDVVTGGGSPAVLRNMLIMDTRTRRHHAVCEHQGY